MDDRIGQQLGNYRLVEVLGIGALTKVYLGEHVYLNTLAAIKVLDASKLDAFSSDTNFMFRFQREAGVLAKLVHPNIIRVLEFGVVQGTIAFLVVTYAPRGTFPRSYPKGSCLLPVIILTLTRFWGVGEEKFGTMDTGGFNGQISTKLYKRIQAASCGVI